MSAILTMPALAGAGSPRHVANPYSVQQPVFTCGAGDQSVAINGVLAGGGVVQIAAGTCLLASPLHPPSNTTLSGAGMGVTIFKAMKPDSFNMVEIVGLASRPINNVTLSGFSLDGSASKGLSVSKISEGVLVGSYTSGIVVDHIESMYNGNSGINDLGSGCQITNGSYHDNFHAGIYVAGNNHNGAMLSADHVVVTGNSVVHNSLQHLAGGPGAWDGIDFDTLHSNGLIENNTVDGGNDILLSDLTYGSGPDQVLNNVVRNSLQGGIRVYGLINGFTVAGNQLTNDQGTGIIVTGAASNGVVSGNTATGQLGDGINLTPLTGQSAGDSITVSANNVQMGAGAAKQAPGFRVDALTHVTLQNNASNGAIYSTSLAGDGLVMTGNH